MRILTGGKFNKIHPGHKWLLRKSKKLGNLTVVVAHDKNNKRAYALPAEQRANNVRALKIANKVVIGSPTSFVATVKKFKPDVIVLGYDQRMPKGVSEYVKKKKLAVVKFNCHKDYKTRRLVRK